MMVVTKTSNICMLLVLVTPHCDQRYCILDASYAHPKFLGLTHTARFFWRASPGEHLEWRRKLLYWPDNIELEGRKEHQTKNVKCMWVMHD